MTPGGAEPTVDGAHSSTPGLGGVSGPADIQRAEWLRDIASTEGEALKFGRRDQVEACEQETRARKED